MTKHFFNQENRRLPQLETRKVFEHLQTCVPSLLVVEDEEIPMEEDFSIFDSVLPHTTTRTQSKIEKYLDSQISVGYARFFEDHPELKQLFLCICSIPAASVEVERLWSLAAIYDKPRQNRILPENLSNSLFIKKNEHLTHMHHALPIGKPPVPRSLDITGLLNIEPFDWIKNLKRNEKERKDDSKFDSPEVNLHDFPEKDREQWKKFLEKKLRQEADLYWTEEPEPETEETPMETEGAPKQNPKPKSHNFPGMSEPICLFTLARQFYSVRWVYS